MPDTYTSWSHLLTQERLGRDFILHCDVRSDKWLIAAPHGGGIEPGTTEIARAISEPDLSFYSIEGIKSTGNAVLHITGHRFDEPGFVKISQQHQQVLTVHGCRDGEREHGIEIWVGGLDRDLVTRILNEFSEAGYKARRDPYTPGVDPTNICNAGSTGRGLQLELSHEFRLKLFQRLSRAGRLIPRPPLAEFAALVRSIIGAA